MCLLLCSVFAYLGNNSIDSERDSMQNGGRHFVLNLVRDLTGEQNNVRSYEFLHRM